MFIVKPQLFSIGTISLPKTIKSMKTTNVEIMDTSDKTSNSKLKSRVQIIEQKKISNKYELEVALKDKVHLETYYNHQLENVIMDKTPTKIKVEELQIARWMLIEDQQLMKLNLGIDAKPHLVNINAQLKIGKVLEVEQLLKEFKNVFVWTYKYLKGIPLELA